MRSSVATIIVGVGQWEEYTKPLIESIKKHEPSADILVVDNGNKIPKIERMNTDVNFLVINDIVCYAQAINYAVQTDFDFSWYVIMNNDVICTGPYLDYVNNLSDDSLYGNKIHHRKHNKFVSPTDFIDGWIYIVPTKAIYSIGYWDDKFKIAGFEDADYCIRAHYAGFKIKPSTLPFLHLEEHIRNTFDNYKQHRLDNLDYLIRKHNLRKK